MRRTFISIGCLFFNLYCFGQDINVTFTPTGEATSIDSVTGFNQRSKKSVTLPGNETLVLRHTTHIQDIYDLRDQIVVHPNPFSGSSNVMLTINEAQKVNIRIQNMTGQVVAQSKQYLQAGNNEFEISLSDNGFYGIIAEINQGYKSSKLVNLFSSGLENMINYTGLNSYVYDQSDAGSKKSEQSEYSLNFTDGDNIHYTCYSSVMTTIFTDSPEYSKNHDVEFAACIDPDGKNYDIVIIGDQIWMEDNLAYLPYVSPSREGSDSIAHYYVYDYEGTDVTEAKATENFEKYGVLYNWPASLISCPDGWHLPGDDEWTILTDYLILNDYYFGADRSAIGSSMASTFGWLESGKPGAAGYDQASNNGSGFNALPAGYRRHAYRRFSNLGYNAFFYTSTPYGLSTTWSRDIYYNSEWVFRVPPSGESRGRGYSVRCLKDMH